MPDSKSSVLKKIAWILLRLIIVAILAVIIMIIWDILTK
jgi:hypothetical protein